MQPREAHRVSNNSLLLDSLKVYLNNKDRLQPIIGLSSVKECVLVGARSTEALYLCLVCVCRLGKADVRNHIMGSLHRFNYIKAHYPHLVAEWGENSDLSKLAWNLMEIAKKIEEKEGAGDVQLIKVEDEVYRRMKTVSESDAVTLVTDWGGRQDGAKTNAETASAQLSQPQRIVMFPRNQQGQNERPVTDSSRIDKLLHLMQSALAPRLETGGELGENSAPELNDFSSSGVLRGYTGTQALIGLSRVVEVRSENAHTCVFLCHCCRVRSNKRDVVGHLLSSSHLINYLMEARPEQVEALTAAGDDNTEFLRSLAEEMDQEEEGRRELKVITAPESLSVQMTGKSYHWCVKMLYCGQTQIKMPPRGRQNSGNSAGALPGKHAGIGAKRKTKRKMKKKRPNTVFKVSLPLRKGAMLLERTSFSQDGSDLVRSPVSDPHPSARSPTGSDWLNSADDPFGLVHAEAAPHQDDMYSEDAGSPQDLDGEKTYSVTLFQEVDSSSEDIEPFGHSEDKTVSNDQVVYGGTNPNRGCGFLGTANTNLTNEDPEIHNAVMSQSAPCSHDWPTYNFHRQGDCGGQWSSSAHRVPRTDVGQHYQQWLQNQWTASGYMNLTGLPWHHSSPAEVAPTHNGASSVNKYPYLESVPAGSAAETRGPAPQNQQRQEYMEFRGSYDAPTPRGYMMQPQAYEAMRLAQGVNYNSMQQNDPACHLSPYVVESPI